MSKPKILVTDGLAEVGLTMLRQVGDVTDNPKISAQELLTELPGCQALIVRSRTKVTAEAIQAGKQLVVIGRAGVGVDNIDVSAAIQRGITVVNSPLASTNAVAEHTLGLMLALARQLPAADRSMKQDRWEKKALHGSELDGKVLGLVGIGRIGSRVAELARAFGMNVLAFDPLISSADIQGRGAVPASLDQLIAQADYLSLHIPLSSTGQAIIGKAELARMKPTAFLLSTARGGLIDENELRLALDSGYIAGAALDVFSDEPPAPGSIATHPKVVATPHIAAQTKEAQTRAGVDIAEEIITVLSGKEPRWRVTTSG